MTIKDIVQTVDKEHYITSVKYINLLHEIKHPKNSKYINLRFDLLKNIDKQKLHKFLSNNHKLKSICIYDITIQELTNLMIDYIYKNDEHPLKTPIKLMNTVYQTKYVNKTFNSTDRHHTLKLSELSTHGKKEYAIHHRLDEYYKKFNSHDLSGIDGSLESIKRYYKIYFNNTDKKTIVFDYIHGALWIFQYYFNNVMDQEWTYKYSRTPLIHDILEYIDVIDFDKISNKIINKSKLKGHFTPIEQLVYITPLNKDHTISNYINNSIVIKKVGEFIKLYQNGKFIPDIQNIAKNIIKEQTNDDIDCSHAVFLNNCNITILEKILQNDSDYIRKFREIFSYEEQLKIYPINKKIKCG